MKKFFLILPFIFLIILTTSCSKDKIIIDKNKITDISFKDIVIKKEDFNSLIPIINKANLKKYDKNFEPDLIITTDKALHKFKINKNNVLYSTNNKNYKTDLDLNDKLSLIYNKYTNQDYYTIKDINNYIPNETDVLVRLDDLDNYIVINFKKPVFDFKIHELEYTSDTYKDISVLYENKNIKQNTKMFIRITKLNIRITFKNEYNYQTSIIPTYNEKGEIVYQKTFN